ncbi:MAG TPA: flagellar protein FliS [Pirellulaceae bacterium]|mgnify:CR=1 FL=1|nr:flagellar protein FliS [Pirellulaceae bacterium]
MGTTIAAYQANAVVNGWTRIDMLLAVYDRAIEMTRAAAAQSDRTQLPFWDKLLGAQKCVLALHSGLKLDECEIAFNVARLLHFVMSQLCEHRFDDALQILESLRSSFEAIRDESNELERLGKIPPVTSTSDVLAIA